MVKRSTADVKKPASRGTVVLACGASGGHMFPALAVADELKAAGYTCLFVLGGGKFSEILHKGGYRSIRLPASALNDRGLLAKLFGLVRLMFALLVAYKLLSKEKPCAVFGTGGYASVATLLAAKLLGIPTFVHEQNVLPGRANRFLARFASHVIVTFDATKKYMRRKVHVLGTPLRAEIVQLHATKRAQENVFRILVLGGSQGARILSDVLPGMVAMMGVVERKKLAIVHQARSEDVVRVHAAYAKLGLAHVTVQAFFDDLPKRYVSADVVVARSGTGTLLETATVGRAAIYVPHQLADNHQLLNAQVAEEAGAAIVLEQPLFTPANLLVHVRSLIKDTAKRSAMAKAALKLAKPSAAADVAAFVIKHSR